ncbi:hypothetical protein QWY86_06725 [Pedobacter aquatilis]|uniref:hypothetical protein n=1 Tax=Pedobacter aquatilis TaxID=351343 RepID=UPI0025B5E549|nr:hypothetical protein [Pedobacter aquatilis]MDN3586353.1 hypothetical protein [Pedobacter aquatilis]
MFFLYDKAVKSGLFHQRNIGQLIMPSIIIHATYFEVKNVEVYVNKRSDFLPQFGALKIV